MTEVVDPVVTSGIEGLGRHPAWRPAADCLSLISGEPGTGKTTLAMQFLMDGAARGERCLYITLSETLPEIQRIARSHGWDLSGIHVRELVASERNFSVEAQLTVFNSSEVELSETTESMIAFVNEIRPQRVVLDSLSELRLIAQSSLRYRRQVLALKQYFAGHQCTVLLLDDQTGGDEDGHLQSIANGVVVLEQLANQYGAERRRCA